MKLIYVFLHSELMSDEVLIKASSYKQKKADSKISLF